MVRQLLVVLLLAIIVRSRPPNAGPIDLIFNHDDSGTFASNPISKPTGAQQFVLCSRTEKNRLIPTTQKCYIDMKDNDLGCFSVWKFTGTQQMLDHDLNEANLHITQDTQGCWSHQPEALLTCSRGDVCETPADRIRPGEQFFCCCIRNNCNGRVRIVRQLEHLVEEEPKGHGQWIAGLAIVIVSLVIAVAIFIVFYWKRCRQSRTKRAPVVVSEDNGLLSGNESESSISKLDSQITYTKIIGKGKYGIVMLGTWRTPSSTMTLDVAVKIVKENVHSFTNELSIYSEPCLRQYEKANILRLLDYEKDSRGNGRLVTEYHPLGNLQSYLKENTIDCKEDCLNIIVTLLDALAYLHEERGYYRGQYKPVILHRDLKSCNILLKKNKDNRLMGVISDFGLSTKCSQEILHDKEEIEKISGIVGSPMYMAPELLIGSIEFTTSGFRAIDIYAMALVMWEIVTRTKVSPDDLVPKYEEPLKAFFKGEPPTAPNLLLSTISRTVVHHQRRPRFRQAHFADQTISKVIETIEEMWSHEANYRITAACGHTRILRLLEGPTIPSRIRNSTFMLNAIHKQGKDETKVSRRSSTNERSNLLVKEEEL